MTSICRTESLVEAQNGLVGGIVSSASPIWSMVRRISSRAGSGTEPSLTR
jgi:hypothetical protein